MRQNIKFDLAHLLPNAFAFSIILTLLLFIAGLIKGLSFRFLSIAWTQGLWSLHTFSMQMVLILALGFTLARAPVVRKCITYIVKNLATTPRKAFFVVTLLSFVMSWLNWGLGLMVSAVLALEVMKVFPRLKRGPLIAASYSGFLVWHGGLSGSIPLKLTDPSLEVLALLGGPLDLGSTVFSPFNIFLSLIMLLSFLVFNTFVLAKSSNSSSSENESHGEVNGVLIQEYQRESYQNRWVDFLEQTRVLLIPIVLIGVVGAVSFVSAGLGLNQMILICFLVCFLIYPSLNALYFQFSNTLKDCAGIIFLFPLYAALMGVMKQSGLGADIAQFFVRIASVETLPVLTFLSAGIVNIFIPSGGGQWVVQGPIALKAVSEVGGSPQLIAMALAWGDAWTNMIQPFFALPILGVTQVSLGELLASSIKVFILAGFILLSFFLISGYF